MANFSLDMSRFIGKSQKAIEQAVRKTCIDLTTSIILDSPIDTSRFRSNWSVSFEQPDESTNETLNWTGNLATQTNKLSNGKIGKYIFIQNNLEYGLRLEYGYSKQAPAGFLRKNIARFTKI